MNKTAIVTGASRGIGAGIARVLAANGYDLALSYNTAPDEMQALQKELTEQYGIACYCRQAAFDQMDTAMEFAHWAIDTLGHVDLLVNNAGRTMKGPLQYLSDEVLDTLLILNFRTYIVMMREVSRHMIDNGIKGNMICITSSRSQCAYPEDGIYGGLKAGINRAIQSFALDVAPYGIRINCVAPGATQVRFGEETREFYNTQLAKRIPLERMGQPEDIGNAVLFLASDKASYITGEVLRVDGGLILPGMPEAPSYQEGWGDPKWK